MQLILCCPNGGDHPVEARSARVTVTERGEPYIEFPCPACGKVVACPLEAESALRLIGLGLRASATRPPAELAEVRECDPPLTPDDLLDLHLVFGQPNWLVELQRELEDGRSR